MLTFFRKIRAALLSEGKTGKYLKYAIGEIFLVVIGILIAIQVNNWNEVQKNTRQEKSILNNLNEELKVNINQLDSKINSCKRHIYRDSVLITYIGIGTPKIETEVLDSLMRAIQGFVTFDPANGVIYNIVNSGQINLIQNDELIFKLSAWNMNLAEVKEVEGFIKEFHFNKYEPYLYDKFSKRNGLKNSLGSSTFSWDLNFILTDKVFENLVFQAIDHFTRLENRYVILKDEMLEMCRIIEEELNKKNED